MPDMDGREFSRRYRARARHAAPLVLMTAAPEARRWCAEIGADACLPKPFDLDELYGLVAGYCGRASSPPGSRLSPTSQRLLAPPDPSGGGLLRL